MLLTKTEITSANDGQYVVERVDEWVPGGEVRLRSLTGEQRGRLVANGDKAPSWDAYVCVMGIVGPDSDAPMFAESEVSVLARKHPATLERLARKILLLSGLGKEAQGEIDANFPTTQTLSGGSNSPDTTVPNTEASTTEQT